MERGDSERIEITISSRFENIELVQVIAEHLCENAGLDEDGSHWIGMAVREAVANAIKHGNKLDVRKKVHARFDLRGCELEITISDEGEGFDPDNGQRPAEPAEPDEDERPRDLLHEDVHGRDPLLVQPRRRDFAGHDEESRQRTRYRQQQSMI